MSPTFDRKAAKKATILVLAIIFAAGFVIGLLNLLTAMLGKVGIVITIALVLLVFVWNLAYDYEKGRSDD